MMHIYTIMVGDFQAFFNGLLELHYDEELPKREKIADIIRAYDK